MFYEFYYNKIPYMTEVISIIFIHNIKIFIGFCPTLDSEISLLQRALTGLIRMIFDFLIRAIFINSRNCIDFLSKHATIFLLLS